MTAARTAFLVALLGAAFAHAQALHRSEFTDPRYGTQPGPLYPQKRNLTAKSQWTLTGSDVEQYTAGIDPGVTRDGRPSGFLRSKTGAADGLASVTQQQPAEPLRGKRVRLGAWVRGEDIVGWAGLWMRIDGEERRVLGFDNMQDRALSGSIDWTWCEVVLDVPADATTITYGLVLHAAGAVWMNGLVLEAVPLAIPITDLLQRNAPFVEVNSTVGGR